MIQVIRSAERHHNDFGWLSARWHFSFDSYYDPKNIQWGSLRVFNDDVIQPGMGFGRHPHRDMEIITYVIDGALEHADSLGTKHVLGSGEVQVMSAGSGVQHSEYNASAKDPVRLLQIWILPRTRGTKPRWEQRAFPDAEGKLLPVVSGGGVEGTLPIDQDATIYLSRLGAGESVTHVQGPERKGYLFVIRGSVALNGQVLEAGDQGRTDGESELRLVAGSGAEFLLIDLGR